MSRTWRKGENMRKGDVFEQYGCYAVVTSDEHVDWHRDRFDRPMRAFRARGISGQVDGREGLVPYGPGGVFRVVEDE